MSDHTVHAKQTDYSIIVPVYCNEGSLDALYETIKTDVVHHQPLKSYEIIFIDDGSHDASFEKLMQLKNQDPDHIKLIKFTRNFGQVPAVLAGYHYAIGDCIINISADLQDPPALINDMLKFHDDENYEIVIGYREAREESWFRKWTSRMFYTVMKKICFPDMPAGGFDFMLISRKVKEAILSNPETNIFLQGQVLWTGYRKKLIPYTRRQRLHGTSKWSFSKKIKYLIDGILGYSYLPLRAMSFLGILISIFGFAYALMILFSKLFGKIPVEGWAPLMIVVLILSGVQMLMLGVIGEYVWRTLDQVRKRPFYIIEKLLD